MLNNLKVMFNTIDKTKKRTIPLSIMRIVFGSILFIYFTSIFSVREVFFYPDAIDVFNLPNDSVIKSFLYNFFSEAWMVDALFYIMIISSVFFTIGFKSRFFNFIVAFLFTSFYIRNQLPFNSGDSLMRLVLLYMMFCNTSKHLSVDSYLEKKKKNIKSDHSFSNIFHNFGVMAIILQFAFVYFFAAVSKSGVFWLDGHALYYLSFNEMYFVSGFFRSFFQNNISLSIWMTYFSLLFQLFFVLLILFKKTRIITLFIALSFHISVIFMNGIFYFSIIMIVIDLILLSNNELLFIKSKIKKISHSFLKKFKVLT